MQNALLPAPTALPSLPQLYMIEPSGNANRFFGAAIGKSRQAARTEIERLDLASLSCREAVKEIMKILLGLREDEKPYEVEMGWISDETGRQFARVPQVRPGRI